MLQRQRAEGAEQRRSEAQGETRTDFRADADECGRWFVWKRLGLCGWAAWRQCTSRADAVGLAASLNRQAPPVPN